MIYKSLILLVFANLFNQAYNLEQIQCPKWVPGSDQVLPQGVSLSPELELENRVRCYCEVVKAKEAQEEPELELLAGRSSPRPNISDPHHTLLSPARMSSLSTIIHVKP